MHSLPSCPASVGLCLTGRLCLWVRSLCGKALPSSLPPSAPAACSATSHPLQKPRLVLPMTAQRRKFNRCCGGCGGFAARTPSRRLSGASPMTASPPPPECTCPRPAPVVPQALLTACTTTGAAPSLALSLTHWLRQWARRYRGRQSGWPVRPPASTAPSGTLFAWRQSRLWITAAGCFGPSAAGPHPPPPWLSLLPVPPRPGFGPAFPILSLFVLRRPLGWSTALLVTPLSTLISPLAPSPCTRLAWRPRRLALDPARDPHPPCPACPAPALPACCCLPALLRPPCYSWLMVVTRCRRVRRCQVGLLPCCLPLLCLWVWGQWGGCWCLLVSRWLGQSPQLGVGGSWAAVACARARWAQPCCARRPAVGAQLRAPWRV